MIEPLKGKQTLKAAELQDGDIICFQRTSDKKAENGRVPDKASQEAYVIPLSISGGQVASQPPFFATMTDLPLETSRSTVSRMLVNIMTSLNISELSNSTLILLDLTQHSTRHSSLFSTQRSPMMF
jgi:uncharacterized protein with WD repeat